MTLLDYNTLYEFGENFAPFARGLRANPVEEIEDPGALLWAEYRPRRAIRFARSQGNRVRDVIWTGHVSVVLISRRFREVLESHGFSGWSTYPVKVYNAEGMLLRGYSGLAITGRCGAVDDTRSKKVWCAPPAPGGRKFQNYLGMFFQDDEWDGSDFCIPEASSWMIVTRRVKTALEGADLDVRNVQFQQLSIFERDAD